MAIKVCGMREPANIERVAGFSPTFMGFIFYDKSPRNAIGLDHTALSSLTKHTTPVAVFVNASEDYIKEIIARYGFPIIQLHGSESPDECRYWRQQGVKVFKALPIGTKEDFHATDMYKDCVDAFVFDTRSDKAGGSGKHFDWQLLDNYTCTVPYLLSGGITPNDVDAIMESVRSNMLGVDINSRFEISPGLKNPDLVSHFISSLRNYDNEQTEQTF